MENRYFQLSEVTTRSEGEENLILEGYFARYDDVYHIAENATESIARGAFAESIKGDVRALYNHNSDVILGRTSAGTLELQDRDAGLWGRIKINPKDAQAVNVYERIARGDITGCSFGFEIPPDGEEMSVNSDGSVHWTITRVDPLYEVSPVVFPAYEMTNVHAREKQLSNLKEKQLIAWREKAKERLQNGFKSVNAEKAD